MAQGVSGGRRVPLRSGAMHEIRAEITANVWQVRVDEGQMVAEGDELVILESMKMEIPVPAEVAGTIVEIAVNQGDVVTEGDRVAEIAED